MAYDCEEIIVKQHLSNFRSKTGKLIDTKESLELREVYAKAKVFDEIVIETTGAIMNCPPGVVETETGKLTLDIIDKYEKQMEDK
ncbi:hypothetical protein P3U62_08290 [Mammaliicoccus vitulinus]|uniref:hypothetical protein n=1 Tax=Mammaliicoccus vitulinus TaxID=71237 RepID=UPI002B25E99E|nr:hypothetical protein [Mammaliicoccus vitulinus]WQK87049.1 hypothetical protein P3U62_08290 [Mammaliicoccus vitulinus]